MLVIRPIHLAQAKIFVEKYHRHNIPPVGGKFAIACWNNDELCGVAICGRPVSRYSDDGDTLEIYRNCTNGTHNACSKLYGACQRIARDMGYRKIITYTLSRLRTSKTAVLLEVKNGQAAGKGTIISRRMR